MNTSNNKSAATTKANFYKSLILEGINFEGHDLERTPTSDKERINAVYQIFERQYMHHNNERTNKIILFAGWLGGLPSTVSVPFYNNEILELGTAAGFVLNTEKKEDVFLQNYFLKLSNAFFKLKESLNKVY